MTILAVVLGIIFFVIGYCTTYVPPSTGFFHSKWSSVLLRLQNGIALSILCICFVVCFNVFFDYIVDISYKNSLGNDVISLH